MNLEKLSGKYKIVKVANNNFYFSFLSFGRGKVFSVIFERDWVSFIVSADIADSISDGISTEDNWSGFKMKGQFSFELSGILLPYLSPLKRANISVLVSSSFDTDYLFVKDVDEKSAVAQWEKVGVVVESFTLV